VFFLRSKDKVFYQTLIDAAGNIVEAVQLFRENVETLEEKEKYADKIKELENKGDDYTHLLFRELNKSFVTPMDREDLLQLAVKLDDVLDGIEACAARFVYFHIHQTTPLLIQFADNIEKCAQLLQEAFIALEKKDYERVRQISIQINDLENEVDRMLREGMYHLFANPGDPIEVLKMKEIYEKLENVTDTFEDLMDVMESVVMKYA
jgi:predicted phosphate transport protein (TIGR00153 family)